MTVAGTGYTVPNPNTTPVVINIFGIRAAIPSLSGGSNNIVTGNIFGTGVQIPNGQLQLLGIGYSSLQASAVNNGIPCGGSPAPLTQDFPGLSTAGTQSSAVRVTEGVPASFLPRVATADTGVRILVNITGYGSNTQVYVPNAIVGNSGSVPTSGGEFGTTYSGGFYTPGGKQLLLMLVSGADSTGAGGGSPQAPRDGPTSIFTPSPKSISLNGAGYAVYEVADSNPNQYRVGSNTGLCGGAHRNR